MRADDYSGYYMILFCALLLMGAGAYSIYKLAPPEAQIASRERVVAGHFVAHVGHGRSSRIIYAYSINGLPYKRKDSCWNWLMPCQVGSEVAVYYDPLNPTESNLIEYRTASTSCIRLGSICITGGIFLLGLYFVLIKRVRKRYAEECTNPA